MQMNLFGLRFPFDVWPTFAARILRHETLPSPSTRREASNVLPVQFGRERFLGEYIEPAIFMETNRTRDMWDRNYVGGSSDSRRRNSLSKYCKMTTLACFSQHDLLDYFTFEFFCLISLRSILNISNCIIILLLKKVIFQYFLHFYI